MLLQQVEQDVRSERQIAVALLTAGAKGVDVPEYEAARVQFDAALEATPQVIDDERHELLAALGLR